MLDAVQIDKAIDSAISRYVGEVEVFDQIDSTNDYLLRTNVDVARARICVAQAQIAGRGRRGNEWQSAPNQNIMLSLSWGFESWPETVSGLSLAIGMVVATRLNDNYDLGVTLKWPNDLLIGNEKLGGILIDLKGQASKQCHTVIGLGLNVWQSNWAKSSSAYQWVDMYSQGVKVDRAQLIGELVGDIVQTLLGFENKGLSPLLSEWNKLSSYSGKRIAVLQADNKIVGRMVGIDEYGALLLLGEDGSEHRFQDSNVSIRLVE